MVESFKTIFGVNSSSVFLKLRYKFSNFFLFSLNRILKFYRSNLTLFYFSSKLIGGISNELFELEVFIFLFDNGFLLISNVLVNKGYCISVWLRSTRLWTYLCYFNFGRDLRFKSKIVILYLFNYFVISSGWVLKLTLKLYLFDSFISLLYGSRFISYSLLLRYKLYFFYYFS